MGVRVHDTHTLTRDIVKSTPRVSLITLPRTSNYRWVREKLVVMMQCLCCWQIHPFTLENVVESFNANDFATLPVRLVPRVILFVRWLV